MIKLGFFVFTLLVGTLLLHQAAGDPLEECVPKNETYNIGDNKECDKYYICAAKSSGKPSEAYCDDGFLFSTKYFYCDYPHNVDCGDRTQIQPSKSTNPKCARLNGFYAFPAAESCQMFYHCLDGVAYEKSCPAGVIFDDSKGACVHPDLAGRKDCSAAEVHGFKCPNAENKYAKLRFGSHDRHAHPKSCQLYFICGQDGNPRLAGCAVGKVFNPKTGKCSQPDMVPGCADYYKSMTPEDMRQMDADPDNDPNPNGTLTNSLEDDDEAPPRQPVTLMPVLKQQKPQQQQRPQGQQRQPLPVPVTPAAPTAPAATAAEEAA